jgi:hypothetical protein
MTNQIGQEALIPNLALKPLSALIGEWKTAGTHPFFPDKTFHGRTSFEWLEKGAFFMMHSEIDEPEIPSGIAIFGSDDAAKEFSMLYFDERGVSRKYEWSLVGNVFKWWRNNSDFSQRFTGTITNDGRTMIGKGEMSKNGSAWERDLELTYTRTA